MLNREVIKNMPLKTGIYIFKDQNSIPVYVGKAKNIRKRVSSYFNESNQLKNEKIFNIVKSAEYIDYIVTSSEDEAFILEANLIFTHKPKYNLLLKDSRVFPYIVITEEKYPTIKYVRNKTEQNCKYFGPYPSVRFVKDLLEVLQRVYKVRTCERSMDRKSKPCFLYHLGKCYAPCYIDVEEMKYSNSVSNVFEFLNGDVDKVKEFLSFTMSEYAKILEFEKAAQMRDTLQKLDKMFIKLGVEFNSNKNVDLIMYEEPIFVLLKIREGYMISKLTFTIDSDINEFIHQFYAVRKNEIPKEVLIMYDDELEKEIQRYLKSNGLKKISSINKSNPLFKIGFKNLEEEIERFTNIGNTIKQAKEILGLRNLPNFIEGIDISHLQGMFTVASLVTFENGKPEKSKYRKYRLDHMKEPNDFESISYVIKKRYSKHPLPDLLFIDGGKGQVNTAVKALKEIGFEENTYDIVGIAKEDERIVFPGQTQDLHLQLDNPVLRLLIYIRDETHRFAIGFNKALRSKRFEKTKLDDISGIGAKRKKILINTFGGLSEIKEASVEQLTKVLKSEKLALKLKQELGGKL
jgi:excinuclease ABC subunit C